MSLVNCLHAACGEVRQSAAQTQSETQLAQTHQMVNKHATQLRESLGAAEQSAAQLATDLAHARVQFDALTMDKPALEANDVDHPESASAMKV